MSYFQKQIDEVYKHFKNTPRWLMAPNGKPKKLTEDQWVCVYTVERAMLNSNKKAQHEFLATGVVPQEGQRTSSADNSVKPVLNMVVRHDC